jgi:hypothetical protein
MSIETVAARLTEAVYPVALRHATVDSWVDLELELWKVLTRSIHQAPPRGLVTCL